MIIACLWALYKNRITREAVKASQILSNQNLFPFKSKPILPNPLRSNALGCQACLILHLINLRQCCLHGILQCFLILRIMYLDLQNDGIITILPRLQQHIIPAESTFPVR